MIKYQYTVYYRNPLSRRDAKILSHETEELAWEMVDEEYQFKYECQSGTIFTVVKEAIKQ